MTRRPRPRAPRGPSARRDPSAPRATSVRKSEATRRRLLERALKLFQHRGVDGTTMRAIANSAGLSLGAAYYYFPSKESLVFAYYEANLAEAEAVEARARGTLRERLGAVMHAKLTAIAPYKKMLGAIVQRLADPRDPVGAFSEQTAGVRARTFALFERQLSTEGLPPDSVALAARGLWLMQMAVMLVFVNDDSPGERRTHGLLDDTLDLVVSMLPMLGTPVGVSLVERIARSLARAGIPVI